ncbi:MAG: hypothetical protein B6U65_00780 [Candidatus Wolframiiraptor sp. EX4484-121]|nr:MAG: hypothetical protein B6U65_00780 [Candidatus Wolframiiraptor sp. EX4484-121]
MPSENEKMENNLLNLNKRVSRRAALSTAAKVGITAVVCGVVAGVGGYFAGSAAAPPKTVTKTVPTTVTATKTVGAATVTETVTKTVTKTVPTTVTATVATTPTTPTGKLFEGVKITGATLAGGPKGAISSVLYHYRPIFKELTGADLDIVELSFADLPVKILADLTTGAGKYDFFVPCSNIMGDLVAGGYVWELDKWMKDPRFPKWDPDSVPYAVAQCSRWGGHWYGVPWDSDAWYLNWNMRYMDKVLRDKDKRREFKDKYGYELNPYKWYRDRELTWQKVRDMCEFFTGWDWNEDGEPDWGMIMGLRTGEQGTFWWEPFVAPFIVNPGPMMDRYHNILYYDPETMDPLVKSPGIVEGTKLFVEICTKFTPKAALTFTFAETWDYFLNKQKAMFTFMPPDTFTLVGNPEKSRMRGYLMTTPPPGSEVYYDLKEKRMVEKINLIGDPAGCHWHPWVSKLSKAPEAAYWFSAYVATPEQHRLTTASAYAWTGIDPGFLSDLLTDYGGTATLADYHLPGGFKDPGYPTAWYNEGDLRRAHIAVFNNWFAMDGQYNYHRIPGATAIFTIIDTHIIGEAIAAGVPVEEALYRCWKDINKVIDDYGRDKMKKWYHDAIGYGKPNPYKPRPWLWDDRVVPKDLIFE